MHLIGGTCGQDCAHQASEWTNDMWASQIMGGNMRQLKWCTRMCSSRPFGHVPSVRASSNQVTRWPRVFLVTRPKPYIAFCPIFVHPLCPVFEPHIQKWFIFVRRRPCVCDTFKFEPPLPGKKDRFWHRLPPRTTTIELPACQERRGLKTIQSVFF